MMPPYDDKSFQALKSLAGQWPGLVGGFAENRSQAWKQSPAEQERLTADFRRQVAGMREAAASGRQRAGEQVIYALGIPAPRQRSEIDHVTNLLAINRGWTVAGVRLAAVLGDPKGQPRALELLTDLLGTALRDGDAPVAAAIVLEGAGLFRAVAGPKGAEAAEAAIGACLAGAPSADVRAAFSAKLEADRGSALILADCAAVEAAVEAGAPSVTVHDWAGEELTLRLDSRQAAPRGARATAGAA